MEKKQKHIIRLFFGKKFTKKTHSLFGRWLRAKEDADDKEAVLQELWDESPSVITSSTHEDWIALRRLLLTPSTEAKIRFLSRRWMKYAAVIALMIFTASVTYWLTEQKLYYKSQEMVEFFVPYGEDRLLTLSDGSEVWVGAASLLIYPKDMEQGDTRTLYLSGEASFSVTKNPKKPFIVKTSFLDIQALGTEFNVQAYPNELFTKATLEEGCIQVGVKGEQIEPSILKPNEQLIYSHLTHTIDIHTVDVSLYQMKREGYLIFENVSLNQLVKTLEREYNVVIQYNSQKYEGNYYNVKFAPSESIENALNVLQQLTGLNYKIKEKTVFIN